MASHKKRSQRRRSKGGKSPQKRWKGTRKRSTAKGRHKQHKKAQTKKEA